VNDEHWTREVFLDHPDMFLPLLEDRLSRAEDQVDGIVELFDRYDVKESSMVLDLACGIGRHSIELASRGYSVIGVDISPEYLAIAEQESEKKGVSDICRFVEGDMRRIGSLLEGQLFSSSLSLFTSLGYYGKETDLRIIRQLNQLSLYGGLLIIHIMCKKYAKSLDGKRKSRKNKGILRIEDSVYDEKTSRLQASWTFLKEKGKFLENIGSLHFENRLYTYVELRDMLNSSGWEHLESFSDLKLTPFKGGSKYIVIVSRKAG
jgi:SAM-dependent methyltransferase